MGSTKVCTVHESFAAAYGSPHELDARSFGGSKQSTVDEIGSSSGSNEVVSPDLGLTVPSTNMEANSFNMQSMTLKSSSINCSAEMKGPKKPDRALPCPRCNSVDTKFCYYNNYNVNQPRHFCKGCQRYWTAGGTLRNVAVGAGRRKRKHSSLESESVSEVSSVEHHHAQDVYATRRVSIGGSIGSSSPLKASSSIGCGVGDLAHTKPGLLPFDASSFASDNLFSVKVQESLSNDLIHAKQSLASQHSSGPLCSSHDNRVHASVFHEFIHSKHAAVSSDKHAASVDHSRLEISKVRANVHSNEHIDMGSKLVLAMPSERQASNESGCASSLTTQGVSVDVCVNDRKSDAMDSEVTKEGEECDKGGFLANQSLQSTHHGPYETEIGSRGASAMCEFSHCDVSGATTLAPGPLAWKRPPENPAYGAAGAMLSMPLSWGPPTDRGLFWGLPWGPAASVVDAAKAALIPNARALQKWPQPETSTELPQKTQTVAYKEFAQKSGEHNTPSEVRVWAPKTLRIQDVDEAARSSIWSTLGIRDGQVSLASDKKEVAFHRHVKEVGIAAVQSQYANPAALSQSMAFHEIN